MIIPVITLWRPWCFMIEEGWKTIETRLHNKFACLNGHTIGIHVGKKWDTKWYDLVIADQIQRGLITEHMWDKRDGQIICTALVYNAGYPFMLRPSSHLELNCKAMIDCTSIKRFGLFLKDINKIETPKFSGSQGIWYYDTELQKKVTVKEFREQENRKEGGLL